jgi:hypothetical protein
VTHDDASRQQALDYLPVVGDLHEKKMRPGGQDLESQALDLRDKPGGFFGVKIARFPQEAGVPHESQRRGLGHGVDAPGGLARFQLRDALFAGQNVADARPAQVETLRQRAKDDDVAEAKKVEPFVFTGQKIDVRLVDDKYRVGAAGEELFENFFFDVSSGGVAGVAQKKRLRSIGQNTGQRAGQRIRGEHVLDLRAVGGERAKVLHVNGLPHRRFFTAEERRY